MSEQPDRDSKTEEPTPKRIQDAIDKGNTPHSREISSFAGMVALGLAGLFVALPISAHVTALLSRFIDDPSQFRLIIGQDTTLMLATLAWQIFAVLFTALLFILVVGVASGALQNPPRMVPHRIKPEWSRLSIMKGLERIFGMQGLVELAKSLAKLLIVAVIGTYLLFQFKVTAINMQSTDPRSLPGVIVELSSQVFFAVAVVMAILAGLDLLWSRFKWYTDLRMTRKEVQDELKQSEGDPLIKMRVRSIQRDRSRRRMLSSVADATVVIANPTHYAVALRYVRDKDAAPIVTAKGVDLIALKIREVAEAHDVPVIEDKALARSLYKAVPLDQAIPSEFYKAVAEIISYLSAKASITTP